MDSLTHIALGACMGEVFAGKKLGKKALLWGAMSQSLPDIDFVASFWMDTASNLLAHRGFTHSFLFCLIAAFVLGLIAEKWHRPHNISLLKWCLFFGAMIFIHVFIDAFNNYGVAWFEPFSNKRISFNAIYVADPFFSIWPFIALLSILLVKKSNQLRMGLCLSGLGLSALYLMYCLVNKALIDKDFKTILTEKKISYSRYFTTPAPLQNWLWYVVAGDDKGYYVGFRSLFDSNPSTELNYFPRNDSLLIPVKDHRDIQDLIRFSQNFYTVEHFGDTLVFNDLRFGQMIGWYNPKGKFVFHYYIEHPADNDLVVQRGRFAGWNKKTARALIERIKGN